MKPSLRRLRLTIASSKPEGGAWLLRAECDDDLTEMTLIGGEALFGLTPENASEKLRGELGLMLRKEHIARCSVCPRHSVYTLIREN